MKSSIHYRALTLALIATGIVAGTKYSHATTMNDSGNNGINVGEVSSSYNSNESSVTGLPTNKKIAKSGQSILKVTKDQLKYMNPSVGGFQLAGRLPGVVVLGSNTNAGVGSNTININGFGVGTGQSVNSKFDSVQINFDGIPMNNPLSSDGGFYSMELPIGQLFEGTSVIYGPGNPDSRWQNSIGGTVNFSPIQPSTKPDAGVSLSYGSYGSKTAYAYANSGVFADGWTAVLAAGYTDGRVPGLEYDYPTKANMFYLKARKSYSSGTNFSFGVYGTTGSYFSTPGIPVTPIAGYTVNGYMVPGQLLSEKTSGYYSTETIPESYFRYSDSVWLFYAKQHFALSKTSYINNKIWFRNSDREHIGRGVYSGDTSPTLDENYVPITYQIGDRITYSFMLPHNHIKTGAYLYFVNYTNPCWLFNQPVLHQGVQDPSWEADNTTVQMSEYGFIQDELDFLDKKLRITPGIAYAAYQTSDANLFPPTSQLPAGEMNGSYDWGSYTNFGGVEPSLSINWEAYKNVYIYGYGAHTNTNPNNREYGNEVGHYVNPQALGLTTNTDYEVGARYQSKSIFASLNYYHAYIKNVVKGIEHYGSSTYPSGFKVGNAVYNGVNMNVDWTPLYWLKLYFSGNIQHPYYTKLTTSDGGSFAGNIPSGIPFQSFLFGIEMKQLIGNGLLSENIDDHYVGEASMANLITSDNTLRTEPYNLVNATLHYMLPIKNIVPFGKTITFSLGVYNLLDRRYNENEEEGSGANIPGTGINPATGLPGTGLPVSTSGVFGTQGAPRTIYGTVYVKF
jgi:iron complex outermembrane receptor protein